MLSATVDPRPEFAERANAPPVTRGVFCRAQAARTRTKSVDLADVTLPKMTSTELLLSRDIAIHTEEAQR